MKTVIVTNRGSLYGKKVLNDFLRSRVAVEAVLVVGNAPGYYWRLFRYVRRRVGLGDAVYFAGKRLLDLSTGRAPAEWRGRPFIGDYRAAGVPVRGVRGVNSRASLAALRALAPDLIVLAQTEIVGRELLAIPKIGALNSHPGILPHYRGIDCAKWAVYNGELDRVGATVHWVDAGVDTGRIVAQEVYDFFGRAGSVSMGELEEDLYDLCAALLTRAVASMSGGDVPRGRAQPRENGRQYFKMPRRLEKRVERTLRRLTAKETACGG